MLKLGKKVIVMPLQRRDLNYLWKLTNELWERQVGIKYNDDDLADATLWHRMYDFIRSVDKSETWSWTLNNPDPALINFLWSTVEIGVNLNIEVDDHIV